MKTVTITRPEGTAAVEVWSDALGQGVSIPAGPCEVCVPAELVASIPGARVVPAPSAAQKAKE